MILLDASALIAFLRGEPAGAEVRKLLGEGECAITAVNLAEVIDQAIRRAGLGSARVAETLQPLLEESLTALPVTRATGWRAGELRAKHYARGSSDLSLGDCILLASAGDDDSVATSDGILARAARTEAIELIALPNSLGERPLGEPLSA